MVLIHKTIWMVILIAIIHASSQEIKEVNFEKERILKYHDDFGDDEKWNPIIKNAVVITLCGAGILMILNGLANGVGNSGCDATEFLGQPCEKKESGGYIILGALTMGIGIGIDYRF